ncbi:MAG: hypothetical protein JOZ87_21665 [Chloroflexi bacterium]|nr:hypothetical protein [Chloroflexota bacterium]
MALRTLAYAAFGGLLVCLAVAPASAQPRPAWEQWQHQVGIVDVGARRDGTLVSMVAGHLVTIAPDTGAATPFADGQGGFSADPTVEAYFVVAVNQAVDNASCGWRADDVYILDLTSPPGIARVDATGQSSRFATVTGVDTLGGIALDTVGAFGHRLLVTGTHDGNQTAVFAIDCNGTPTVLTTSAPLVEGGISVAPPTFGHFGGDLIASDENSGQVWAIDASGDALLVGVPNLPTGGDTGVESEGFVPPGFISSSKSGYAYLSDRGTPDNPFPGTDSLLRISSTALASAGVQDGDLLVATEGNGTTVAIRCADTCQSFTVAQGTQGGHIEGHLLVVP